MCEHRCGVQHVVHRRVGWQSRERTHGRGREHHGADFLHVQASDDHVLDVRCTGGNDLAAQRSDADEGAGGQLEVFGDPAVELQALVHIGLVDPLERVAGLEETFLVEGFFGLGRHAPVAGCDVGAAIAHLGLAFDVHQLELHARGGQAQVAGLDVGAGDEQAKGA